MPQSARSRAFTFTFYPHGSGKPAHTKAIPINSFQPVAFENDYFKGCLLLVHDTGNEPGLLEEQADKDAERRGLEVQIQGRFKPAISPAGNQVVLWAGGELNEPLKLGWITRQVLGICTQFAKKKTEGRINISIGNKTEPPIMTFPIGQVLTCIITPKGNEPPKLGSPELAEVKWKFVENIPINCDDMYTFLYKTPFVDLCSWELLKVPGVSPLALESLLGDVSMSHIFFYDLNKAGSHGAWREGTFMEWVFARGNPGDSWVEEDIPTGAKTPLSEASDPSEASEEDEVDDLNEADEKASEGSDVDSDSSEESIEVDEEELSKAETAVLQEIVGWRPRNATECYDEKVKFPYYIEAIDRRRKKKLVWWCVFSISEKESEEVSWNAKAIAELAGLLGKRRRWRTFRRGLHAGTRGATRGCSCYAVQTLELFRQAVNSQLQMDDSRVRRAVLTGIAPVEEPVKEDEPVAVPDKSNGKSPSDKVAQLRKFSVSAPQKMHPSQLARKLKETHSRRKRKIPLQPPRFFQSQNSRACELAFKFASEGRGSSTREGLVGAVHFEGRVCEELLRLDKSGALRCFTPYDADRPRLRLFPLDIIGVEPIGGLFLGRFHCFRVLTVLRTFVFCCAIESERQDWLSALKLMDYGSSKADHLSLSPYPTGGTSLSTHINPLSPVISAKTTFTRLSGPANHTSTLLMDGTRARRWRPKKRLVLNDRVLIDENTAPPSSRAIEEMLKMALQCGKDASLVELVKFLDATSQLKAMQFAGMNDNDLTAFWINVYHCLLLHGWLILGTPKSRRESARFYARVSYLVGERPVSLKEIERVVLRIPDMDFMTAVSSAGRARAEHFLSFCCLRRRRANNANAMSTNSPSGGRSPSCGGQDTSPPRLSPRPSQDEQKVVVIVEKPPMYDTMDRPQAKRSYSGTSLNNSEKVGGGERGAAAVHPLRCLPMPQLPAAPWRPKTMHACLFLGRAPEKLRPPREDKRIMLCLNRGNQSCLPGIVVFDALRIHQQLDTVAQNFMAAFVKVTEHEGRQRVILPHHCRCLRRDYNMDPRSLLSFVWKYMPQDQPLPQKNASVKFDKYRQEPRERLEFICESANNIEHMQGPGAELAVLSGAAKALERLVSEQEMAKEDGLPEIPARHICATGIKSSKERCVPPPVPKEATGSRAPEAHGTPSAIPPLDTALEDEPPEDRRVFRL